MSELLSPVGNKEAFYASIANGCDAIYLGLNKHNARAYADNFTLDNLKEYVDYAHLRNVKVYVTLNTIVYDSELSEIYEMIDELAKMNVDAIIVQDLAVVNYTVNNYKSLEVHASTQMGIDDVFGAKLLRDLGVKRVVLARETPLNTVKYIKDKVGIEVETFVHGALCVSYSGNCFMSASIGERSGNRGRCAGCCRKQYSLIDLENKEIIKTGYLLSMKDLNLSSYIKDMSFVDSFKIEGRMKESSYVACVTNTYRKIIDNEKIDTCILDKVFNRTYTKGFIFNESSEDISNILRPNNYGYPIGKVIKTYENKIWIKLFKEVNQGDQIRIEDSLNNNDVNLTLTKIFNPSFEVVTKSNKTIVIYLDKKVRINSMVYKIKDIELLDSLNLGNRIKEYKKLPINVTFDIRLDSPLLVKVTYQNISVYQKSEYIVTKSNKTPTRREDIVNHFSKLNETPYYVSNFDINLDNDVFVPVSVINDIRREVINKLNASRLNIKIKRNKKQLEIIPIPFECHEPKLCVEVSSKEQYDLATSLGIENIYYKNIVRRNNASYIDDTKEVLIGGLSSLEYYKDKDVNLISDYSLNVNNHISAGLLSSLGVNRITLSSELNKEQIDKLISEYINEYHTHPNLEMIVYGRAYIMHSKYCPLKKVGLCGKCKKGKFALKDNYESFPIRFNDDCSINLLNSKTLNLLDDLDSIRGVSFYRLVFTTESLEEMKQVILWAKEKINGNPFIRTFDGKKHTRGNFKKILL